MSSTQISSTYNIQEPRTGNNVLLFTDNRKLFSAMLADMICTDGENDFVYMANWWCDIDIPLGDPNDVPQPPMLRDVLSFISKEKPDPRFLSSTLFPPTISGAQICAMLWRHKKQIDISPLPIPPTAIVPNLIINKSIFGDELLSSINTKAAKHIGACSTDSRAILDGAHRLYGSHHQKLLVIKNKNGLIAYVGSADFNADRLYPKGGKAKNPPSTAGAPLEDVALRIKGPAATDVLKTFVDRWKLHPECQNHSLRGENYSAPQASVGNVTIQVTHTYGMNYPYKGKAVRSAADTLLNTIKNARRYIYLEDQYLLGTEELSRILRDNLNNNIGLTVVAVMASSDVADLPYIVEKRSDFWRPLVDLYPSRIKLFEMTNRSKSKSGDGSYLHAKLSIIDDIVTSIGSVNCNNRSWYHDSEILVTASGNVLDNDDKPLAFAAMLRLERWSRHLGLNKRELLNISDGLAKWNRLPNSALVQQWNPLKTSLSKTKQWQYDKIIDPT